MNTNYVGTIVGESTSREFRLAVAHETIREQDIIAVDAELRRPGTELPSETIRIWAKVQRIERLNPLFPSEAGHELAVTQTDPFDTVLSLSREMVTAVCQVLGAESLAGNAEGKLDQLRYPAKPASSAYRPDSLDIARVVMGELSQGEHRGLDIATLANREDVNVLVDGHAIVSRHLAILAMTGAGKSWTARKIIEELAQRNYPMVIFDPHGDYSGLADVFNTNQVKRFYAQFPVFQEDADKVATIVSTLGYALTPAMLNLFPEALAAAKAFFQDDTTWPTSPDKIGWLDGYLGNPRISQFGIKEDLWLVANVTEVAELAIRNNDQGTLQLLQNWGWQGAVNLRGNHVATLDGIKKRTRSAASALLRMEQTNLRVAQGASPLPMQRTDLVQYGQISVVSLAGYTAEFQATLYSIVVEDIFSARITGDLQYPVVFVLEEAHNFAPAKATSDAENRAITNTRQIAQEGRKFGIGLLLISQRPSRLDETTLSQCNSFVIMRMVNPADQAFVRRVVETLGEDEARILPDLDVGEGLISGQMTNFPVLVKFKSPQSQGEREEKDAFIALEEAHSQTRKQTRRGS